MSEDVLTSAPETAPPVAPARSHRGAVLLTWVGMLGAAVLVAIALPGWLEVPPWRIVAAGKTPTVELPPKIHLSSAYMPQRTVITIVALVAGLIAASCIAAAVTTLLRRRAEGGSLDPSASRRAVQLVATANGVLLAGATGVALSMRQSPFAWRRLVAFDFANYSAHSALYILNALAPQNQFEVPVSSLAQWGIAAGVVLVALLAVIGASRLRLARAKPSKYVPFGAAGVVMALVVVWVERSQLLTVPQYYLGRNNAIYTGELPGMTTPQPLDRFTSANTLFIHSGYGSVVVAFGLFVIVELVVLAALLIAVTVLAARRKVSPRHTVPVVLVRNLAVVVAVTVLVGTLIGQIAT